MPFEQSRAFATPLFVHLALSVHVNMSVPCNASDPNACNAVGTCVAGACVCPYLVNKETHCERTFFAVWGSAATIYALVRFPARSHSACLCASNAAAISASTSGTRDIRPDGGVLHNPVPGRHATWPCPTSPFTLPLCPRHTRFASCRAHTIRLV